MDFFRTFLFVALISIFVYLRFISPNFFHVLFSSFEWVFIKSILSNLNGWAFILDAIVKRINFIANEKYNLTEIRLKYWFLFGILWYILPTSDPHRNRCVICWTNKVQHNSYIIMWHKHIQLNSSMQQQQWLSVSRAIVSALHMVDIFKMIKNKNIAECALHVFICRQIFGICYARCVLILFSSVWTTANNNQCHIFWLDVLCYVLNPELWTW